MHAIARFAVLNFNLTYFLFVREHGRAKPAAETIFFTVFFKQKFLVLNYLDQVFVENS
jgi:hypothetical protein